MSIRFDEKGKFFTDVISKDTIPVVIQTIKQRIHGNLHIRPDQRLKDEINIVDQFIAITDGKIYSDEEDLLFKCDFLTINRDHIVWILPQAEIVDTQLDGGKS